MKKIRFYVILTLSVLLLAGMFLMPRFVPASSQTDNIFDVTLNGQDVGTCSSEAAAQACLRSARRAIAVGSLDLVYMDVDMQISGRHVLFGRTDDTDTVTKRMEEVLRSSKQSVLQHCFTVKIGTYTTNLSSEDDVNNLMNQVLDEYNENGEYKASLVQDTSREVNVLTGEVLSEKEQQAKEEKAAELPIAGIDAQLSDFFSAVTVTTGKRFEDYETGLTSMKFGQKIEVTDAYVPASQISTVEDALQHVSSKYARNQIHEVQQGDVLSTIAEEYDLTVDDLISMNPILSDENSIIRPGDELTVTVPSTLLPVIYTRQEIYEEDYNADVIYKDNDSWYTTRQEVIQEPETGHRKVVASVTYQDGTRQEADVLMQQIIKEAVPEIIERGTQDPPTFIWPVYGSISSGFGSRARPKAGASTYHQGIDIAVPTGTSVMASSGGTVVSAGWQSGYGNVIYIQHGDGTQTRYGHLSRILVSVGQRVSQGSKIALSGNTGNSTGPHLHFEIRINGSAVNPLNYLQ